MNLAFWLLTACLSTTPEPAPDAAAPEGAPYTFDGGYPTADTIERVRHELAVQRVSEAYLQFLPSISYEALFQGTREGTGLSKTGDLGVYTLPGKGKRESLGLTFNTESVYALALPDLSVTGPLLLNTPPGVLGVFNSVRQTYLSDIGTLGPDRGQGGRYLLLPPGYEGDIPEGVFVVRSPSYDVFVMTRGPAQETGTGEDALKWYGEHFSMEPLDGRSLPPSKVIDFAYTASDTIPPDSVKALSLLNDQVQREPLSLYTPAERGLLASIGIEKGKAFTPDDWADIYEEGIARGVAFARVQAFASPLEDAHPYPDRNYEALFAGGRYDFTTESGAYRQDAATLWAYSAIVVTPAMAVRVPGQGSQYLAAFKDKDGQYLDGSTAYKLHLPGPIPAANFWSVTAYEATTRSLLQGTSQEKPSLSSFDRPATNPDGSVDLFFGPEAPADPTNWIETPRDQGWFFLLRLYGPEEAFLSGQWKPDDVVKLAP